MSSKKDRQVIIQSAVETYYDDIYRFCRYYTGNETDSYDITQEVFLRFMKYMDSCEHRNIKGYLIMIARNLCCDYFRRRTQMREKTVSLDAIEHATENTIDCMRSECISSDKSITDCDSGIFLCELLQSIPPEQREVVILRIHDGLKFQEISNITGCSLSTAKSRFRLGIASMKKKMGDNYG
ncbi:MAG: RNA polymerase sigma factor [Lachnospiraceae bacterium]|nr:RNA polymerase sigma factor [Lachnospiraceae bacterium]